MSQTVTNPIQNISYTSKDFETIYPEILDLVKELTYKWDPSLSNESDPGVILIKLLAIFEDKCNYNIDKNILECFPLSVTQETNAKQLFEQLGYYMHWYRSATTNVSLKWIDKENLSSTKYTIPAFTMVTDSESSIVYSLIGPADGLLEDEFKVASQPLSCNGEEIFFKAIQGIAVNYDIAGNTLITTQDLDSNNRLYFNTTDIAENGIFIHNYGLDNYSSWKKRDNLLIEEAGNTYYKFGVSNDGYNCYIEFPEDAEEIFKNGIYITYIKTLGLDGNVGVGILEKFYNDIAVTQVDNPDNSIVLNINNVRINNTSSAGNGKDNESINDAYLNYKKTVGTFTTLVTLRDYTNAVNLSPLVSNGFVCDRTNDIQSTYKISSLVNDLTQNQVYIEPEYVEKSVVVDGTKTTGLVEEPSLNAYSLKLYLLRYVNDPTTQESFNKTFGMLNNVEQQNVKDYIEDDKLISHDYYDIKTPTNVSSHFCYFKNKYPLDCEIYTQYKLSKSQAEEVKLNVRKALFNKLNSHELEFGEEIDKQYVIDIIEQADDRIKSVKVGNIEYNTFAVYFDGTNFNEVLVSQDTKELVTYNYQSTTNKKVVVDIDYDAFIEKVGNTNYSEFKFTCEDIDGTLTWTPSLDDYGIEITDENVAAGDSFTARISLNRQFRDEIYTKSVLAGATQFYVKDEKYDFKLNQIYQELIDENICAIKGNVNIQADGSGTQEKKCYTLRTNESIQFYAPNLLDSAKYTDYVKYQCILNNNPDGTPKTIKANCDYELQQNEFIIFYWKTDNNENSLYSYYCYGKGNIIKPTFNLTKNNNDDVWCTGLTFRDISTTTIAKLVANSSFLNEMTETQSANISKLTGSGNVLSGSKTVSIREINQISLNTTDYRCYWITNTTEEDSSGNKRYILFDNDVSDTTRILGAGEYFIYSNEALTSFVVLGSGTKIERNSVDTSKWSVEALDTTEILENGTAALMSYWFKLSSNSIVTITENQFITLNPGCVLYMQALRDVGAWTATFTSDGVTILGDDSELLTLSDFLVSYTTEDTPTAERVYINDIVLDNNVGWDARSILNVYMSPTVGMRLLDNQTITYKYIDGSEEQVATINGAALESNIYPVCLMSSRVVSNNTGEFISIIGFDDFLNTTYVSLYKYKECVTDPTSSVRYMDDGSVIVDLPVDNTGDNGIGNTVEFEFSLPGDITDEQDNKQFSGRYILKMTNGSDSSTSLHVALDGTNLHTMYSDDVLDASAQGTYYVYLPMQPLVSGPHTLSVTMKGNRRATVVSFSNPYKYVKPTYLDDDNNEIIMSTTEFNKIESLLSRLDTNHIFNYTNEISEDNVVVRPLQAKEFVRDTHIYNQYTICQLDTTRLNTHVNGVGNGGN